MTAALGRWDDLPRGEHRPDEPPHGLMMRLATRHRNPSADKFAESLGIAITDVAACMEVLAAYEHADAYPEQLECLRSWVPETFDPLDRSGLWRRIRGQEVRRDDWSVATRRFCPACLAEEPYHRGWFDLTFMRTCPEHGLPIVDRTWDGSPAGFATASIVTTAAGERLDRPAPRIEGRRRSLEAYALARLGLRAPWDDPMLGPLRLGDVVAVCETIGLVVVGGGGRSGNPTPEELGLSVGQIADVGFGLLASGRAEVVSVLKGVACAVPDEVAGAVRIFGWAYEALALPGTRSVRDLLSDAAYSLGRGGPAFMGRRSREAEYVSLVRVADEHGIARSSARTIAEALGLLKQTRGSEKRGPRVPLMVAGEEVQTLVMGFEWGLRRESVAEVLQVSPKVLHQLIRAGHVESAWRGMDGDNAERFHFGALLGFVEGLPFEYIAADDPVFDRLPALMPLPSALEVARGIGLDVIAEAYAGKVTLLSTEFVPYALGHFYVRPDEPALLSLGLGLRASKRPTRVSKAPVVTMTKREACTLLGVTPPTVATLIAEGHLSMAEGLGSRERHALDRGSVARFGERYLAGRYYADAIGIPVWSLRQMAEEEGGIVDLLWGVKGGIGNQAPAVIYERAAMTDFLNLPRDPDLDLPGDRAWKRFATHLGKGRSGFMVKGIKGERKAECVRNNQRWKVMLTVGEPIGDGTCHVMVKLTLAEKGGFDVRAAAASAMTRARPPGLTFKLVERTNRIEGSLTTEIPGWAADADTLSEREEQAAFQIFSNLLTSLLAYFSGGTGSGTQRDIGPTVEVDEDVSMPSSSVSAKTARRERPAPTSAIAVADETASVPSTRAEAALSERPTPAPAVVTAGAEPIWSWADVVPSKRRASGTR